MGHPSSTGFSTGEWSPTQRGHDRALPTNGQQPAHRQRQSVYLHHDINSTLGTIMMLTAAAGTDPGLSDVNAARLDSIESCVSQLRAMIEQYLCQADDELVDVIDVVREVVEPTVPLRGVRVQVLGVSGTAIVSPTGLWRCLVNLVDNAVRAAGACGAIEVRIGEEGGRVRVEIDDSGPGFGAGPVGAASVGLRYVTDFLSRYGGRLEIGQGRLGGAQMVLDLPAAPAAAAHALLRT